MILVCSIVIFNPLCPKGDSVHGVDEGLRRQVDGSLGPGSTAGQAPALPRALRLRRGQFHQGAGDTGQRSHQDNHCGQLSFSVWVPGMPLLVT